MKNMQFLDLMNSIDADLLLDAEQTPAKKTPKSVVVKRLTAAACATMILTAGIAVALSMNNPKSPTAPNQSVSEAIPNLSTIEARYPLYRNSFLVRGEFNNIVGLFHRKSKNGTVLAQYLIVEFKVAEDYYNKLESGTTFLLPIYLFKITEDDVRQLLHDNDQFIFYSSLALLEKKHYFSTNNEKITLNTVSESAIFQLQQLIPIKDGLVNTKDIYQIFDKNSVSYTPPENIKEYSNYIADGMTVEEVGNNLRKLYQVLLEKNAAPIPPKDPNVDY